MKHTTQGVRSGVPVPQIGGIHPPRPRTGSDKLTDRACSAARPEPPDFKKQKLADGKGLYLLVQPNGAKLWRLKYRHGGTERTYAIGAYPEVSLVEARAERDKARKWLHDGKDPVSERRLVRAGQAAQRGNTFETIAREFIELQAKQAWSPTHRDAVEHRLERELLPDLGALAVDTITPQMVLATLKKIEKRGALETASKCRVLASQVFCHAIVTGRLLHDPAATLAKAMIPRTVVNRATIPLAEMKTLFKALSKVPAEANTKLAFYWLALTAVRTSEMRFAVWQEIEGGKLWRIPAERLKMRREHLVPLSRQAQQVLKLARPLRRSSDGDALIFPGFTKAGSLSENALLALLARAGFYGRQTSHGLRASFSTWAHEVAEADPDVVEACLAHQSGDVRGIYNRATYLSKRLTLLQAWGDQLEKWGMKL